MRWGTFQRAALFQQGFGHRVVGMNEDGSPIGAPKPIGLGGWICWGVRALGVIAFGGAVATLSLPWLAGWGIVETVVFFAATLMLSHSLLTFHYQWLEVEATLVTLWAKFKKRTLREQAQVMAN